MARGSLYELQTQIALSCDLNFFNLESAQELLEMATNSAKLINGLLAVLEP